MDARAQYYQLLTTKFVLPRTADTLDFELCDQHMQSIRSERKSEPKKPPLARPCTCRTINGYLYHCQTHFDALFGG